MSCDVGEATEWVEHGCARVAHVSLLGDVTSPITVAHYVTMTSDYVL